MNLHWEYCDGTRTWDLQLRFDAGVDQLQAFVSTPQTLRSTRGHSAPNLVMFAYHIEPGELEHGPFDTLEEAKAYALAVVRMTL